MSKVKLAVLLIKKEYQDFRDVIKEDVDVNFFDLHPELELDGVICIGANTHRVCQDFCVNVKTMLHMSGLTWSHWRA